MDIERASTTTDFFKVLSGKCFEKCGEIYVKGYNSNEPSDEDGYAVNLKTGSIIRMGPAAQVTIYNDAKVII